MLSLGDLQRRAATTVTNSMRLVASVAAVCILGGAASQVNRTIPAQTLKPPPTIDGVIGESEWDHAAKVDGFVDPNNGSPSPFDTAMLVGVTAEALYIAAICRDPDPRTLQATEYRRDASLQGNDRIIFIVNLFATGSESDISEFEVGAGGGMNAQFAGGRVSKREWQGEWDAKASITTDGYIVEMVIPWKILASPGAGKRDIEVNFGRYISRRQQTVVWSNIGPDERMDRNGKISGVELPETTSGQAIQLLPYQIVGYDDELREAVIDTGIDLRYQAASKATMLWSINPDFRNVENAILGLEFSRFERLADERRPFFVEGADYYSLGGMSARLFAPQRVGGFDAGAKFFGKLGNEDLFSALATVRFDRETNAMARYRRTWDGRSSATAGIVFHENHETNATNASGHFDITVRGPRWGGDVFVSATDDSLEGTGLRTDVDVLYSDGVIDANFGWQRITSDFFPRVGFAPRRGFRGFNGHISYDREFSSGPLTSYDAEISFFDSERLDGGGVFYDFMGLEVGAEWRSGIAANVELISSNFLGDKDRFLAAGFEYPNYDPYRRIEVAGVLGTIEGERYRALEFGGMYRFPFRISVSGGFEYEWLGTEFEQQHVVSINYEMSSFRTLGGRVVYRDGEVNWYLSFRQSGNLGVEYFLIIGNPNADSFQPRVVLKVVVPFSIRL